MNNALKYALFTGLILIPSISLSAEAAGGGAAPTMDKATARITGSQIYVPVTGLNVPIAHWDGYTGMMAVDVGLEIEDKKQRKYTQAIMPRVRDALRQSIHVYMNGFYENDTVPDLDLLSRRMQRAVDKALGQDVAKVTIASAIIHPY